MHDPVLRDYVIRFSVPDLPVLWGERTVALDYVSPVMGTLQHGRTEGELTCAGKFSFQHIRIDWAKHDGFALVDLFALTPTWQALYPLLFDTSSERFTTVKNVTGSSDVLFIDEISILPEHRGRRLAGTLVERLASMCFRQWAAMVVRAAPESVDSGDWPDLVYAKPFAATGAAANKKLRVYWAAFGFRPLGKGDFLIRDATTLERASAPLRAI